MRISDWSSDVCSSDLQQFGAARLVGRRCGAIVGPFAIIVRARDEAEALARISEGRIVLTLRNEAHEFAQRHAVRRDRGRGLRDTGFGVIADEAGWGMADDEVRVYERRGGEECGSKWGAG